MSEHETINGIVYDFDESIINPRPSMCDDGDCLKCPYFNDDTDRCDYE
jgi:hypothetical protein